MNSNGGLRLDPAILVGTDSRLDDDDETAADDVVLVFVRDGGKARGGGSELGLD